MQNLLGDLQTFSKGKLKKTDTTVRTVDGRTLLESKDNYGHIKSEVLSQRGMGFVGDYKPDLQVAQVMPGLFFGSQDVAADFELLHKHCITHILNVASYVDNWFPRDFVYKQAKIYDVPETPIVEYFPTYFKFIDEGRENGNVFVHCNAGVSRAASIVIGYVMKMQGMDFQKAFDHVKSVRPSIRPNEGFMSQLKAYEPGKT